MRNFKFAPTLLLIFFIMMIIQTNAFAGQWYKGDLHSHSLYSDGDSTVTDVIKSVEDKGLDFFALTDHDTDMAGEPIHWLDPAYQSTRTVLLYGVEWTTADGHANIWSALPFDYAAFWQANQAGDPNAVVKAAQDIAGLFSINHPVRMAWDYPVVEGIDCVEIWNGPMLVNQNFQATHAFWDAILMERRRITGVGGSDTHNLNGLIAPFTGHGNPTTWVYAQDLDAENIISGIAQGHVSVSYTVDAPRLDFTANMDGDTLFETLMGDTILTSQPLSVQFKVNIVTEQSSGGDGDLVQVPDDIVEHLNTQDPTFWDLLWFARTLNQMDHDNLQFVTIIKDAEIFKAWLISGEPRALTFSDTLCADTPVYYRAELYGEPDVQGLNQLIYGLRIAVSNPIYVNYD